MIKNIMRYSVKRRDRINVKGFGFLSFVKIWVKVWSVSKDKISLTAQKISTTDALKTASKMVIQQTAEANSYLIRKKKCRKDHKGCFKKCPRGLKQINATHKNRRNINPTNRNTETDIHTTKRAIISY